MVGTRYAGRVPGGRGGGRGGGRDGGRGGRGGRGRGAGRGDAPPAVDDDAEAVLAADADPVVTEEGRAEALQVLGFNAACRAVLTDADRENLTAADLCEMHDDEAHNLVRRLQKQVPPLYVNGRTELRLKTACYIARHYQRTNRTFRWYLIDSDSLKLWSVTSCS